MGGASECCTDCSSSIKLTNRISLWAELLSAALTVEGHVCAFNYSVYFTSLKY